ncbi:MAG: Nif3-like dinuclear metal center hexameric protein [Paludibacteraceae bacterium]|nr:Nif3-like dinuclear metal center hexameric protein [Paludibacteraceae bacterium]
MTQIKEIIDIIEAQAPRQLQDNWDNSGWQIGPLTDECTGALLCLDVTEAAIEEAKELGCNLIIAHHPPLFRGLKQVNGETLAGRCVIEAVRAGISIYAAHTSLDRATEIGVSNHIAGKMGWTVGELLECGGDGHGYGVIATTPTPTRLSDLLQQIKDVFGCRQLRHNATNLDSKVQRIAVCSGSGAEFIELAHAKQADAYLTGDLRHHAWIEAPRDLTLIDMGHSESEQCTKEIFFELISKKIPTFAVYFAKSDINPIQYF